MQPEPVWITDSSDADDEAEDDEDEEYNPEKGWDASE
jgi:hypothetical protein